MIGKLTEVEMEEVLLDNVLGHIGFNDGSNTFVYPTNYVYDGNFIICHSQAGHKIQVMRKNKRVCLQVDEINKDINWRSVMVLGDYQELVEERDRHNAMKLFVDRFLPLKIKDPSTTSGIKGLGNIEQNENTRPVFYRILIDEKSGRFEDE
jgi:nitroimidazol reductase NimA-like FMN-containing flavoprotein (pyridoxamine 5'-phosphate oxidase superfamily)